MIEDKRSFLHLLIGRQLSRKFRCHNRRRSGRDYDALSYALDPLNGLIEVLTPHKLMSYDLDLHFIKSSHLPTGVDKDSETNLFSVI